LPWETSNLIGMHFISGPFLNTGTTGAIFETQGRH